MLEEVLKERNKHLELINKQLAQQMKQKDTALEKMRDERDDLRIKWSVMGAEVKHLQDSLTQNSRMNTQNRGIIKRQGFIASLIFLLSSVLVNVSTTLLTSNPPNSLGWVMMAIAVVAYAVAALMTTLFAEGGN